MSNPTNLPVVGFVTPPAWYDPSVLEFQRLVQSEVGVQQTILNLPDFDYDDLDAIALAENQIALSAKMVAAAGAQAIGFTGTPFTWAGLQGEDQVRARLARLQDAAGVPLFMPGTAMVDAMLAISAQNIGIFAPYYTKQWLDMTANRFQDFGFEVALSASAADLGLVKSCNSIDEHDAASAPETVIKGFRRMVKRAPGLEAIAVPGTGVRTAGYLDQVEAEIGIAVVPADVAVYWSLAKALDLPLGLGKCSAA